MEMSRFRWGMNELYSYFGRKPLSDAQERVYWGAVRNYSDSAWTKTINELLWAGKPMPGGLPSPQELRAACQRSMEGAQEGEDGQIAEHFCSECGGRGILESYLPDDPMRYVTAVRCGHCENWRRRFSPHLPISTRQALEARGRVVLGHKCTRQEWEEEIRIEAAEIARAITEHARAGIGAGECGNTWAQYLRRLSPEGPF